MSRPLTFNTQPAIWHKWTDPALTPSLQDSTWFTYPGRMEGRVNRIFDCCSVFLQTGCPLCHVASGIRLLQDTWYQDWSVLFFPAWERSWLGCPVMEKPYRLKRGRTRKSFSHWRCLQSTMLVCYSHWYCGIIFYGGKCFVSLVNFCCGCQCTVQCWCEGYFLMAAKVLPHFVMACYCCNLHCAWRIVIYGGKSLVTVWQSLPALWLLPTRVVYICARCGF